MTEHLTQHGAVSFGSQEAAGAEAKALLDRNSEAAAPSAAAPAGALLACSAAFRA